MPQPLLFLKSFMTHALASARYLKADAWNKGALWRHSCNVSRFHYETELPALKAMIAMGADPLSKDGGSSALHMAASEARALPLLRFILSLRPGAFDQLTDDGRTPAMIACYWQNIEALKILAPFCSFEPGEGDAQSEDIERRPRGPLAYACESMDHRCAQICLERMTPAQVEAQLPVCLRMLKISLSHLSEREEKGMAQTADMQASGISETPGGARCLEILNGIISKLPLESHLERFDAALRQIDAPIQGAFALSPLIDDGFQDALALARAKLEARHLIAAASSSSAAAARKGARL